MECRLHKSDGMRCHEKFFSLPSTPLLFSHWTNYTIQLFGSACMSTVFLHSLLVACLISVRPPSIIPVSDERGREGERSRATGEFALCSIRPDLITGLPDYNDTPLNSRNCHCVSDAHRWISLLHHLVYACHSKRGRLSSLGRAKGN